MIADYVGETVTHDNPWLSGVSTDSLRCMEGLIGEVANQVSQRMIGDAVDRVVHIRRTPQGRCVEAVIAVNGFDGDVYMIERLA